MPAFNIDTTAIAGFTQTLKALHKSALPSAVRGTLNDAAYNVKTNTMPQHSEVEFKKRVPNFFRANSKFENASGFDVNTMKSQVGFIESGLKGENNFAIQDLKQQDEGGTIDKKSFIPLEPARVGNNPNKPVRPNARLKSIKNIVTARNQKGKTKGEQFVTAVMKAGAGGYVLGSTKRGENILWRVDALISNIKTKQFTPKLTALYDWKKGRRVKVKSTGFMKSASLQTAKMMAEFYFAQAMRQIKKFT